MGCLPGGCRFAMRLPTEHPIGLIVKNGRDDKLPVHKMGGCRCTYRNCTVKSDGKTHMFHYPIYDKVRCHKWLTNAMRLEFLYLKLSQLRNRVVCQHHFRDDNFMNYMKDKLTFDAVPTEDGPFCDYKVQVGVEMQDFNQSYISFEDIENDLHIKDKKANFSQTYIDFLTNGEFIDLETSKGVQTNTLEAPKDINYEYLNNNPNVDKVLKLGNSKVDSSSPSDLATQLVPYDKNRVDHVTKPLKSDNSILKQTFVQGITNRTQKEPSHKGATKANKIKIITEKRLIPLNRLVFENSVKGEKNQDHKTSTNEVIKQENLPNDSVQVIGELPNTKNADELFIEITPIRQIRNEELPQVRSAVNKEFPNIKEIQKPLPKSPRNKIPPERIAAIHEKRKFNMKVAAKTKFDKINSSKTGETTSSEDKKINNASMENLCDNAAFTSIEARLERMENMLLSKIDHNSHKISDLKNMLTATPDVPKKKVVASTQTDLESYKKHLYKEVSRFLSSNANSIIYEELFINNCVGELKHDEIQIKRPKRQRLM